MSNSASVQPRLLVERAGRVLTVKFNNPPHHFYDERMSIEFDELTRRIRRDKSIGAVVLTGQDTAFTHLDLPDLVRGAQLVPFAIPYRPARILTAVARLAGRSKVVDRLLRKTPARAVATLARTTGALKRMTDMDTVFVAAINGNALAFGCIIALACDTRLMAHGDYVFGLPESEVAMFAGAGGSQRLVRMVGPSRAADMLFDGSMLTPDQAYAVGLVNRLVPPERLGDEAIATATHLASRPRLLNREIKRALYDAGTRSLTAGINMETASMMAVVTRRGMAASITKLQHEFDQLANAKTGELVRRGWSNAVQSARETSGVRAMSDDQSSPNHG